MATTTRAAETSGRGADRRLVAVADRADALRGGAGALQAALAVAREDDGAEEVRATALQVMYAALGPDRRL